MSKFRKNNKGETPKISTASLPDIVFMLLFFFMVATVLRDNRSQCSCIKAYFELILFPAG